jgi:ribitol 2-dehydrogenase
LLVRAVGGERGARGRHDHLEARAPGVRPRVRRQLLGTGVRIGAIAPGVVLNDLWGVSDPVEIEEKVARAEGIRSEEVADAVGYMLTRPPHVTIRDLVILPSNQPI